MSIFADKQKAQDAFNADLALLRQYKNEALETYRENILILGEWNLAILRDFINDALLGKLMGKKQDPWSDVFFQEMKNAGFLRTNIQTLKGYSYSQKTAATEFLISHSDIHTLVLGCGSFMPFESCCKTCAQIHHPSKGEMTVSLYYPGYGNKGSQQDLSGSACDVIADMTSDSFWEGVKEGLQGRKLLSIQEHNYYKNLIPLFMHHVKDVLEVDGLLEIHCKPRLGLEIKREIESHNFLLYEGVLMLDYVQVLRFKFKGS